MAKPGRKKRKTKRKSQWEQLARLPFSQIARQGKAHLQAGEFKEAIPFLNAALSKNQDTDGLRPFLFRAYLKRSAQLREKAMVKEAGLMLANAEKWLPASTNMAEEDLVEYLSFGPVEKSAALCHAYLKTHDGVSPRLERALAGLLVQSERWDLLDPLPTDSPLLAHAPVVRKALVRMNRGDWEGALEALKGIPRASAFFPLRAFSMAMTRFFKEDEAGLHRALSMIPREFPLFPLAQALRIAPESLTCLWEYPPFSTRDLEALLTHVRCQEIEPAAFLVKRMALAVLPENPRAAMMEIIQYLRAVAGEHRRGDALIIGLIHRLLPGAEGTLLQAKINFYRFENGIVDAARYLQVLDTEFPVQREWNQAASQVLIFTVLRIISEGTEIPALDRMSAPLLRLLGIQSSNQELLLIEMLSQAVTLDPRNESAYRLISQLPRPSREAKRLVEDALEQMAVEFPEDPYPCLALSQLQHEKNAFRKAEAILEEAKRRAPHDARIIDAYVICLLISAQKRVCGNKPHLALEDFEKAQSLCQSRMLPLVTAKRLLFNYDVPGQASLFGPHVIRSPQQWREAVAAAVERLTPFQRLNTLGMIALDMEGAKLPGTRGFSKKLKLLLMNASVDIPMLTSREIRTLLTPLDETLYRLMPCLERAGVYLKHFPGMLQGVNHADIVAVLDAMIAENLLKAARNEIQRRLRTAADRSTVLLEFYLLAVKHLDGRTGSGRTEFQALLDRADQGEREQIRAAARRISQHASDPLKTALTTLDFQYLDPQSAAFPEFDVLTMDEDENWGEDKDFWIDEEMPLAGLPDMLDQIPFDMDLLEGDFPGMLNDQLADMVENAVDELDLRGAPIGFIREMREEMKRQTTGPWVFDLIAKLLDAQNAQELSRESWEFLYGKD